MQTRPYGKLGYNVSAFGMGCMRLPRIIDENGARVDLEKAFELIRYAAQNGVTYFDTAYSYHSQTSESVLGEALDGGLRQGVKVATKQPLGAMTTQGDIRKNLENTLKKLRTDYIDVYLIHNIQAGTWDTIKQRDIIGEYERFRSEGLIKAIGFSYHGQYKAFKDILDFYDWDMCQVQQNILDTNREATAQSIVDAGEKGTAMVVMEPLRGGGLATPPQNVQAVYDTAASKRSAVDWAFRHLLDSPYVSTILSGVTTIEQLKDNIRIFSQPDAVPGCLSDAERQMIKDAKAAYESLVYIPCTTCEYCLPCPQKVNIPGVFSQYNEGMMFGNFNQPRRSYMFMEKGGVSGENCIGCRICEEKCPQKIQIAEQIQMAHQKLAGWKE